MTIEMPVEVLNDKCTSCAEMDIHMTDVYDLWAGTEKVGRNMKLQCSHLALCKRLRKKFQEERDDVH